MPSTEDLRETLFELDALRRRDARRLREAEALLAGVERMAAARDPAGALEQLLGAACAAIGCGAAALAAVEGADLVIDTATLPALEGARVAGAAALAAKPRRVTDLAAAGHGAAPAFAGWRALLVQPVPRPKAAPAGPGPEGRARDKALLCLDAAPGRFAPADLEPLSRLARLAAQIVAARRLVRRNELLAAVVDGASVSISVADATDPGLPLVHVNAAFERLTGWRRAEVIGRNCRFLSAEAADSPARLALREAVAERRAGEFELLNRRRDGTPFWNRLTLFPVRDGSGRVLHLVATQVDVTESLVARRERDEARRRVLAALSAASEGFLLLDAEGRVALVNDRWRDLFDLPGAAEGACFAGAWRGALTAAGVLPEAAAAAAEARLAAMRAGGEREERRPDGRILLVNEGPAPEGGALSIATDVTRLKAAERQLAERAVAIDAARDGVALTDPEGRLVYVNAAWLALFGHAREGELLGRRWTALLPAPEAATLGEAAAALSPGEVWRGEVEARRTGDEAVTLELSLTALAEGGRVCVARDVSERLRARRERERLHLQVVAAQRQEAVGRLASGVAHDFNNLLSAISGSAELLLADLEPGDPRAEHARRILAAGESAAALTARLLDLGGRRREARRLDLREPVAEAADLLRAGFGARLRLEAALPAAPLPAVVDRTEALQVALNLGLNARDAIGAAAGTVRLALEPVTPAAAPEGLRVGAVAPGRAYARLVVEDDGPGLTPEAEAAAFEPFFTTKGDAGTGLGLAIVAGVAEAAGGAVALRRSKVGGARFEVWLPAGPRPAGLRAEGAPGAEAAAAEEEVDLAGRTVLVVEDLPEVSRVIADALERAGAETAVCEDPRDALEAVTDDPGAWGLLVTDFDMPHLTGLELAHAARAAAPGLAILLCTALAGARAEAAGAEGVVDGVLAKPATPSRLLRAARAAIRNRQLKGTPP